MGARAALVIVLTVVAYLPVRTGGIVFDDHVTYTSFWVEYHLWGLRPAGYHEVNVVLHALNAVLVGLLLWRLAVPGAWLAALLFALHPVQMESVAWISGRRSGGSARLPVLA